MKSLVLAVLLFSTSAFASQVANLTDAQKMDLIRMVALSPAPAATKGDNGAYVDMLFAVTSYVPGSSATFTCSDLAPQHSYDQCSIMLLTTKDGTENTIHILVDANVWPDGSISLEQIESVQYP